MKQQPTSKGLLALTSDQIEEALAKGFLKFVNSTAQPYRKSSAIVPEVLLPKKELGAASLVPKMKSAEGKSWKKSKSGNKKSRKGRTPIRSQTGHDHDRNHHKN